MLCHDPDAEATGALRPNVPAHRRIAGRLSVRSFRSAVTSLNLPQAGFLNVSFMF
jgi:hypothetical protein